MSLEELNTLLNDVLESEDYIRAIAIRDEINSRKRGR
jgi:protein-arginine kinase activator protein McsA